MADVTKGTNFFIVPKVDRQSATAAEAQIQSLVQKAAAAVESGNDKVLANLNAKVAKATGAKNPEVKVKVSYETNSATGQIKEVRKLSASALDPMIADYKKMVAIQGQSALKVKQELNVQRDKLNMLKQQALTLNKQSAAYKRNANAQKLVVAETKKLETTLRKVSTLASLKGQLRAESQKLSMMSQYNLGLNKQGQQVAVLNQQWVQQKALVQGLSGQVAMAGVAAQGFGAKVAAAGMAMQSAFGWIAAVVAGLTAIAGAIGAITSRVKDIQSLKLTFEGMGQSIAAQNEVLASAKAIALSYGVSLRKVEGAFRRLGPAILESGGSLKDTETAIKSIAARTTMLGLNTEQAGRYIEAFAQVMGKGKLQSEELNQQFSELDGGLRGQLKNWLAANKGITDFEGAMKNGEITAGLFLEAFEAINEEIRSKFLRSIADTQQAIENMGGSGTMTLNQLNAKLQTLSSIGLESVGKALAPLGKELMKIYAAFVQVFTKIATEMPGIQALFQGLGHVLGVIAKVSINTLLLGFGVLMQILDIVIQKLIEFYNWLKQIPIVGDMLKGIEDGAKALNANFDQSIDIFSTLSDETTGAKAELEKYNDEMATLGEQLKNNEITQQQYHEKVAALEAKRAEAQKKIAAEELAAEQEKMDKMLEMRNQQLDRDEQLMQRKIDGINQAKDEEVRAIDETISNLERQKSAVKEVYDAKIESVKRAAELAKRAIEDEMAALRQQKEMVKRDYSERIAAVKSHYSQLKAEMDAAHSKEMAQMDAKIARLREAQSAEMRSYDSGPAQERLNMMKIADLRKRIASESDSMKKQEMRAEIERMQNAKRRAAAEVRHQQEMKKAMEEKAELERKQAEEKKKLEEEEKKRVQELQEAQKQALQQIADALTGLSNQKRQDERAEKDAVDDLKSRRDAAMKAYDQQIQDQKDARTAANEQAMSEIEELERAHQREKEAVEDIEYAIQQNADAQDGFGSRVDSVTNGALQRQLEKVQQIRREMDMINAGGGGGGGGNRASGGPVSGGTTYTVNEVGTEGFMDASGRMREIKAPAWGQWKAPGSGTVIPAHIWKNIKAGNQTKINMPRQTSPGNAVARAISTINNTGGDNIQNAVTIQASNPIQAANNMMVQLNKVRRRRMGL